MLIHDVVAGNLFVLFELREQRQRMLFKTFGLHARRVRQGGQTVANSWMRIARLRRFLGGVNVFTLWQIGVIAIGLGVLYRRKSTPIMITLFVLYAVLVAVGISIFSAFTRGGR